MLTIRTRSITIADWYNYIEKVPQSNLLQSWDYGVAMLQTQFKIPRFAVIEWEGREVGIFMLLEQKFFKLFTRISLERGPLWFSDKPSDALLKAFFSWFDKKYSRRPWRSRWILPELPMSGHYHSLLTECGWQKKGTLYQSIWLDISADESTLRSQMKSGWRGHLNQALKDEMTLEINDDHKALPWLLNYYQIDKKIRGYQGPSASFLVRLWKVSKQRDTVLVLRAVKNNEPIAGVLLFIHGQAATYQTGWTSAEGRKSSAHHYLLWQAILQFKEKNIRWLDLGGITDDNPGLEEFKSGLGGEKYELAGVYY